ncbi:DUF2357 domain-containing protein [Thermococcus pacificus]|uniref:DUF2357 domain-containing protein n=1 Tax=Thermococcus pacificus TaxID=71998 RepID=A0A218P554_9EURY|nr:DUF2357 domain-containing protein [Thermococcus pacificus]ASJ05916.1 hypothetical protein A3L08_00475 [Thermococcus pacificus]
MECIDGTPLDGWRIFSAKAGCRAFKGKDKLYLIEWTDYYVEGTNNSLKTVLINGKPARRLKNGLFVVSFGNFVGLSELVLLFESGKTTKVPVEVLSLKVSRMYPELFSSFSGHWIERLSRLQNAFVETLTGEILQYSSAIPFHLESPTGFSTLESDEPINELFAYRFLRSNGERIIEAFETVLRRMKRKLVVEEELLRPDEVDEITPEALLSIVQHPEYLAPAGEGVLIADYLNGYAPTKVLGYMKYESFDTLENRFAKYFLNLLIEWSERVIETLGEKKANLGPIKELRGELEFIGSDGVWDDVGGMTLFHYTSQTLLKGDGYRDLLELYREFTARVPFFEELQRATDNKDIAKLYEYWAFFGLVEELGEILGKKELKVRILPSGELSERGDVYAEFDNGWRLYYNKPLSPTRWSYSVSLRPDFSLFNGNPSKKSTELIGVFDAKFKLDVVDKPKKIEEFDEETETAEKTGNYETWAKLEDVYKMHTYRDALGCRFAVVVYPGERSVFFDMNRGKVGGFALEEVLTGELNGVGYLRLVPEVKK